MKNENKPDKIPDIEGFRLPGSYFQSLGERISEEISLREATPSKEGFILPEGYFANLENRLKSIPETHRVKMIPVKRITQWTAVAAVFALVIWTGWWKNSQNSSVTDMETLSQTEIQNYLEKRNSEWDAYLLGDLFSHEQLDEIALGDISLSNEEMMQYLLEQEVFPVQP